MRFNPKDKPTAAELFFMGEVAQLPCIKCGKKEIQVHHITECGRRLGNWYVIPLCVEHHRAINNFQHQMKLCRHVYTRLGKHFVEPPTKIVGRRVLD